jgi:hypothetical protein
VSSHLAVMVGITAVDNRARTGTCRWLSEPVLAEASAYVTMGIVSGYEEFGMEKVTKLNVPYHMITLFAPALAIRGK